MSDARILGAPAGVRKYNLPDVRSTLTPAILSSRCHTIRKLLNGLGNAEDSDGKAGKKATARKKKILVKEWCLLGCYAVWLL
jgi:hypothetical protein